MSGKQVRKTRAVQICFGLAGMIVPAGTIFVISIAPLVLSGGEYATPPPSLWDKARELALLVIIVLALAGVPAMAGVYLIWRSRQQ